MARLFFAGDFLNNNGPASVNKALRKFLPPDTLYSEEKKKIRRIIELLIKTAKSDYVLFSGLEKINVVGFIIARLFKKKSAYLMHGSNLNECKINNYNKSDDIFIEKLVLKLAPKIICVSEYFMSWLIENYPEFRDKITFVNNGVEWDLKDQAESMNVQRDKHCILSVGGGIPQKNILSVCKAIELLNNKQQHKITFVVIGKIGKDTEEIKSYPFVQYIEKVSKEKMILYYRKAQLYIQNSIFDTFGLAPIEALLCGCDLLVSINVGSNTIISDITEDDIITDTFSTSELSSKIARILNDGNNKRLVSSIDPKETSIQSAVNRLLLSFEL